MNAPPHTVNASYTKCPDKDLSESNGPLWRGVNNFPLIWFKSWARVIGTCLSFSEFNIYVGRLSSNCWDIVWTFCFFVASPTSPPVTTEPAVCLADLFPPSACDVTDCTTEIGQLVCCKTCAEREFKFLKTWPLIFHLDQWRATPNLTAKMFPRLC